MTLFTVTVQVLSTTTAAPIAFITNVGWGVGLFTLRVGCCRCPEEADGVDVAGRELAYLLIATPLIIAISTMNTPIAIQSLFRAFFGGRG